MGRRNVQKEKKELILEALGKCLLKKSFRETTIKDISEMAGMTHGILHYYFKSKNDILLQFIDTRIEKYITILQQFDREDLNRLSHKKIIEHMYEYTLDILLTNQNDIKVIFEIWSIANYDEDIRKRLKDAYASLQTIGTRIIKKAGYKEKEASLISKSMIVQLTGLGIFSGLFNHTEDIKDTLRLFYQNI